MLPGGSKEDTKGNNSIAALAAIALANQSTPGCSATALTPIDNSLARITNESRTQYSVSSCSTDKLGALGFTTDSTATLTEGTSTSSIIASTINMMHSSGSTNIEVTFSLNDSGSSIEIGAYSTGSGTNVTGPAIKITPTNVQARKANGTYVNFGTGGSTTSATGTTLTYCLDFQHSTGLMFSGWLQPCAEVPSSKRSPMSNFPLMSMPMNNGYSTTQTGTLMYIVLNKAKLSGFVVGSTIGQDGGTW